MHKNILRVVMLGMALTLCRSVALANPAPKAKATPKPLTYSGYVRSFYFTRTNNQTGVLNQATLNTALSLHAAYDFSRHFSIGGSYLYANPLDGCTTAADQLQSGGPCSGKSPTYRLGGNKYLFIPVPTNPDNTLPGFQMNTLYEAFLQYKDRALFARVGNQVVNTPWANSSDSRLKPVAFQGGDVSYALNKRWTLEAMFMDRFESRVDSAFLNSTLLTATNIADAPGAESNLLIPAYSAVTTSGFGYGRLGYKRKHFSANLHLYDFTNIAMAQWLDAKWSFAGAHKTYLALQAGNEANTGNAVIGKINSQVVGLAAGMTPAKNLDLSVGFDFVPQKTDYYPEGLPTGWVCGANDQVAASKLTPPSAPFSYFLPAGGTTNCSTDPNSGQVSVYYGGWASPYTDSYATDPLFTTSMTQGQADRRSAGSGVKLAGTWFGDDKQIRLIASHAWYAYGNGTAGVSPTQETDIDGTYFFSPVPAHGPYHGFSLRQRYGERTQAYTQLYGGIADFKYNRTQLEYDF